MISPDSMDITLSSENRPTEKELHHRGHREHRVKTKRAFLCDLCGVKYLMTTGIKIILNASRNKIIFAVAS